MKVLNSNKNHFSVSRWHSRKTFNLRELYQAKGCIPLAPEKEIMVLSDGTTDKLSWPAGDTIRQTVQVDEESGL